MPSPRGLVSRQESPERSTKQKVTLTEELRDELTRRLALGGIALPEVVAGSLVVDASALTQAERDDFEIEQARSRTALELDAMRQLLQRAAVEHDLLEEIDPTAIFSAALHAAGGRQQKLLEAIKARQLLLPRDSACEQVSPGVYRMPLRRTPISSLLASTASLEVQVAKLRTLGIGAELAPSANGNGLVIRKLFDGAARNAGLQVGDIICSVRKHPGAGGGREGYKESKLVSKPREMADVLASADSFLAQFLEHGDAVVDPSAEITLDALSIAFRDYCKQEGLVPGKAAFAVRRSVKEEAKAAKEKANAAAAAASAKEAGKGPSKDRPKKKKPTAAEPAIQPTRAKVELLTAEYYGRLFTDLGITVTRCVLAPTAEQIAELEKDYEARIHDVVVLRKGHKHAISQKEVERDARMGEIRIQMVALELKGCQDSEEYLALVSKNDDIKAQFQAWQAEQTRLDQPVQEKMAERDLLKKEVTAKQKELDMAERNTKDRQDAIKANEQEAKRLKERRAQLDKMEYANELEWHTDQHKLLQEKKQRAVKREVKARQERVTAGERVEKLEAELRTLQEEQLIETRKLLEDDHKKRRRELCGDTVWLVKGLRLRSADVWDSTQEVLSRTREDRFQPFEELEPDEQQDPISVGKQAKNAALESSAVRKAASVESKLERKNDKRLEVAATGAQEMVSKARSGLGAALSLSSSLSERAAGLRDATLGSLASGAVAAVQGATALASKASSSAKSVISATSAAANAAMQQRQQRLDREKKRKEARAERLAEAVQRQTESLSLVVHRPSLIELAVEHQDERSLNMLLEAAGESVQVDPLLLTHAFRRCFDVCSLCSIGILTKLCRASQAAELLSWMMGCRTEQQIKKAFERCMHTSRTFSANDALRDALHELDFSTQVVDTVLRTSQVRTQAEAEAALAQLVEEAEDLERPRSPMLLAMLHDQDVCTSARLADVLIDVALEKTASLSGVRKESLLPARAFSPLHLFATLGARADTLLDFLNVGFQPQPLTSDHLCTPLELSVYCDATQPMLVMLSAVSEDAPQVASALLAKAAEVLNTHATIELLEAGADPMWVNEYGLTAIDVLVQRGAPFDLRSSPRDTDAIVRVREGDADDFSRMVTHLMAHGADPLVPSSVDGVASIHHMLAHVPWSYWPEAMKACLSTALQQNQGQAEGVANDTLWPRAGVHALAACPSPETMEVARLLLDAGASPRAQLYGSKSTALHIVAAGGAYVPDKLDAIRTRRATDVVANHGATMIRLLLEHGGVVQQRDAFGNLPMHLACKTDNLHLVQCLCQAGGGFEAPWTNRSEDSPLDVAPVHGEVRKYLLARKAAQLEARHKREATRADAESLPSTIDSLVGASLDEVLVEELVTGQRAAPSVKGQRAAPSVKGQRTAPSPISPVGGRTGAVTTESPAAQSDKTAARGSDLEASAPPTVSKLRRARQFAGRSLCGTLQLEGQPYQVVATRHVLSQLRLLDQAKRETTFRLVQYLARGADDLLIAETLTIANDHTLHISSLNSTRPEGIWLVWERDEPVAPEGAKLAFYEVSFAVRIWSVETTPSNTRKVAEYVARAWELGRTAADVRDVYPMGTTATADRPGDTWHPVHAEDDGDLQIPYIIKWFALSNQLAQYLLVLAPEAAEETSAQLTADFQLPMLLDERERALSAFAERTSTSSRLVVGRSGTGKTSIALDILCRIHTDNVGLSSHDGVGASSDVAVPSGASTLNTLFVCKSKTLCVSVAKHFDDLARCVRADKVADCSPSEAFTSGQPLLRPLFASTSELYTHLDRSVQGRGRFFVDDEEACAFVSDLSGMGDSLAALDREDTDGDSGKRAAESVPTSEQRARRGFLTFARFCKLIEHSPSYTRALKSIGLSSVYREVSAFRFRAGPTHNALENSGSRILHPSHAYTVDSVSHGISVLAADLLVHQGKHPSDAHRERLSERDRVPGVTSEVILAAAGASAGSVRCLSRL